MEPVNFLTGSSTFFLLEADHRQELYQIIFKYTYLVTIQNYCFFKIQKTAFLLHIVVYLHYCVYTI